MSARTFAALGALVIAGAGCAETPTNALIRSLQSSGPVAFLCLADRSGTSDEMGRRLDQCSRLHTPTINDFSIPHLYALVTQPISGEVAVVDLTSDTDQVLDQDPLVPGSNFLPVGASPTDIVSTPGSAASFVAVAEPNFEAIYALPSAMVRSTGARLTSWPSCRLPAAPGRMAIAVDPANASGALRPSCEAGYGDADTNHANGDLSLDAELAKTPGRYKLIVTLPAEGGFAVIDAQTILDQTPGSAEPCVIERWVPLEVALPTAPPMPPPPPPDAGCVNEPAPEGPFAAAYTPLPAGLALDDRTLYIADRAAPVIHRIDMPSPCEPVELPPLVVTSAEDPERVVTTRDIALSPLTIDLKRYLYAIDDIDGSILAYDVSDGVSERAPLTRPHPETNPFQPIDRIRVGATPRAIVMLQHQNDKSDPETGATSPVRCDPDPASNGPGIVYRTSSAFDSGAGPVNLRGVFAFAVLTNGSIFVLDVDDWDAPCRGPRDESTLAGCTSSPPAEGLARSGEYSCNTVAPHQARSLTYLVDDETADIHNQPGVASFPLLFDAAGTLIKRDSPEGQAGPFMLASSPGANLVVGQELHTLCQNGFLGDGNPCPENLGSPTAQHTLAMNLTDPRAHIVDQNWSVTFEGELAGFSGRFAQLEETGTDVFELSDQSSFFCSRGVLGKTALLEELVAAGGGPEAEIEATSFADYVQIASDSPVETDGYWNNVSECTYQKCQQDYGATLNPRTSRDLRIIEATQDRLQLEPRDPISPDPMKRPAPLKCCFPNVVEFKVRGSNQWILFSDQTGFLHNVTVGDSGVCRKSCDPAKKLLTGRAREAPRTAVVNLGDPLAFQNPFVRFAIYAGEHVRGMTFRFATAHSFRPLTVDVGGGQAEILPTAARFLDVTGELVVSDGGLEGITFIDLNLLAVTRQFN